MHRARTFDRFNLPKSDEKSANIKTLKRIVL